MGLPVDALRFPPSREAVRRAFDKCNGSAFAACVLCEDHLDESLLNMLTHEEWGYSGTDEFATLRI